MSRPVTRHRLDSLCYRSKKEYQIDALISTVESLKAEIQSLKAASCPTVPMTESYSAAVRRDRSSSPAGSTDPVQAAKNTPRRSRLGERFPNVLASSERKFNVVLYGVDECPSGLSKLSRFESDLSNAITVLSSIYKAIEPKSVKDCYRLRKFSPSNSRPRPILVKFIRVSDATSIRSKRSGLTRPHVVKPDMPPEQRERDSVLMRERWRLIQSGVHRSNIKIKYDRLFVGKKLHGTIVDNTFHLVQNEQCTQQKQREADYSSTPTAGSIVDNTFHLVQNEQCTQQKQREADHPSTPTSTTVMDQPCRNVLGSVNPGFGSMPGSTPATNTSVVHATDSSSVVDSPVSPSSETPTPPINT